MNSSKINDWLALIANVAVVGGIVFLAIEISQNNELLRSESRQSLVANDVASLCELSECGCVREIGVRRRNVFRRSVALEFHVCDRSKKSRI